MRIPVECQKEAFVGRVDELFPDGRKPWEGLDNIPIDKNMRVTIITSGTSKLAGLFGKLFLAVHGFALGPHFLRVGPIVADNSKLGGATYLAEP